MNKKTIAIIIGCLGAVKIAVDSILISLLPEDKKALVTGIVSAVFTCADTILVLLLKNAPQVKGEKDVAGNSSNSHQW